MTGLALWALMAGFTAAVIVAVSAWRRSRRRRLDRTFAMAGEPALRGVREPAATFVGSVDQTRRDRGHLVLGSRALVFMPTVPARPPLVIPSDAVVDAQVIRTHVGGEGTRAAIQVTWIATGQHRTGTWIVDDPARWVVALSALST